jgi:hypothetical protein
MQVSSKLLTKHLNDVDETYHQHFFHAAWYSVMLLTAAVCALVHAVLPFLFETTTSRIIYALHAQMEARHLFDE